jgi:hypothetical protein
MDAQGGSPIFPFAHARAAPQCCPEQTEGHERQHVFKEEGDDSCSTSG